MGSVEGVERGRRSVPRFTTEEYDTAGPAVVPPPEGGGGGGVVSQDALGEGDRGTGGEKAEGDPSCVLVIVQVVVVHFVLDIRVVERGGEEEEAEAAAGYGLVRFRFSSSATAAESSRTAVSFGFSAAAQLLLPLPPTLLHPFWVESSSSSSSFFCFLWWWFGVCIPCLPGDEKA